MVKLSWRAKLMMLFALVLGASLLFQFFFVVPQIRKREVQIAKTRQEEVARSISRELDVNLNRIKTKLMNIAKRDEFRNMDIAAQQATMTQHAEISHLLRSLSVMNAEGWYVSSSMVEFPALTTRSYADQAYFTIPFKQGRIYFCPPGFDSWEGIVKTSIAVPIELETGERTGVLIGTVWLNDLIKTVADYPLKEGTVACVVDKEGMVVVHSDIDLFKLKDGPLSLNYSSWPMVQAVMAGQSGKSGEYNHNGISYYGMYSILKANGWGVVVGTPMDTILAESKELTKWLLLVNFVLFVIGLLASIVFTQQITALQRRAEKTLRESEKKYRLLITNIPYVTWISDSNGNTVFISSNVENIYGYTSEEICMAGDRLWFRRVHSEDSNRVKQAREMFLKDDIPYDIEYRIQKKDGNWIWLHDKAVETYEKGGMRYGYGIFSDVTERKQMEEALWENMEKYRTFFESSRYCVFITSIDGRWIDANDATVKLFGYETKDELLNINVKEVYENVEDRKRYAQLIDQQGFVKDFPINIRRKNGSIINVLVTSTAIKDKSGTMTGFQGVIYDITERKQMEERLRRSEKMEAIGQLAGGIAHDFNNQLTGIIGYADLIREEVQDNEMLCRYSDNILRTVKRASDLTAQLLAFARKGKYLSVSIDIHSIITEVVSLLSHSIDKKIKVKQNLHAKPPVTIGDPTQIQNALLNLAINASDAMPDGGELIFATETLTLEQDYCRNNNYEIVPGPYLQVCVSDTGVGMDIKTQEHIFEPFFTTKAVGKGTGMGLSAVYGTVRSHRGAISVYSELGYGTTFKIYLPLHEAEEKTDLQNITIMPVKGGARVLLVDDEDVVLEIVAEMLRSLDCKVVTCKDGDEAVKYYKKSWKHIDLVILDMVMPKMDGRETFLAMREINPDVKVILSSGYSINGKAHELLDEGVMAFIQKPYRRAILSQRIAEILQQ